MCVIFDEVNRFDLDFHQHAPNEVTLIVNVNMYQQIIIACVNIYLLTWILLIGMNGQQPSPPSNLPQSAKSKIM